MNAPDFYLTFRPLTAHPYDREDCRELAPARRCGRWCAAIGGRGAVKPRLVVPDGCVDVILTVEDGRCAPGSARWISTLTGCPAG